MNVNIFMVIIRYTTSYLAVALGISIVLCSLSQADIFRFINEEGIECYTDAPIEKGATRILKEKITHDKSASKRITPRKYTATGIIEKNITPPSIVSESNKSTNNLPVNGRITSSTGIRRDPIDGMIRSHQGVDIATPIGTPIRPVAAGIIAYSGYRPGYGNLVIIEHNDGMLTLYAHNSATYASVGDQVEVSSTIALSGNTGRSTGPHLHFEAWKDGTNLTDSFVSVAADGRTVIPSRHEDFRKIEQADGSILFTNLP